MNHDSYLRLNRLRSSFANRVWFAIIASIGLALTLLGNRAHAEHETVREPRPESWKADAELTDVFFVNAQLGWAVGAQGAILRTTDAGKTWEEISQVKDFNQNEMALEEKIRNLRQGRRTQTTGLTHETNIRKPIRCRFESVHFVDEKTGWVAGGYQIPYVNRSRAVVMQTNDGGVTWKSVEGLMIPRVRKIRFESRKRGWLVGDAGNLFSSGISFSSDGGQTWGSDQAQRSSGWISSANKDENSRVMIDAFGRLGHFDGIKYENSVLIGFENRDSGYSTAFSDLMMLDSENGVAVGKNGIIARTSNGGRSWQRMDLSVAAPAASQIDFCSVALAGQKLWLAGNPGSCLVSLDLKTGVTQVHRTPVLSRINRIAFADADHGFAVGEFGVIIATIDGGRSWTLQRGQEQSSALMVIAENSNQIPMSLLAQYSVEENRICNTLVLRDSLTGYEAGQQAIERLGCLSSRLHSIEQPDESSAIEHRWTQQDLQTLVKQIRILRPVVIVCPTPMTLGPSGQFSEGTQKDETGTIYVNAVSLIKDAIRMADDASAFPEHQLAGLGRHQVSRLVTQDSLGPIRIDSDRLLPRSGETVVDATALSRALIGKSVTIEKATYFQVTNLTGFGSMRNNDLLSGLSGSIKIPTRSNNRMSHGNLTDIQKATERSQKLEEFAKFEIHHPNDVQVWRRQVDSYITQCESHTAAIWLLRLAERYQHDSKPELSAQAIQFLSTRWTDSPYSLAGLAWLSNYYSSREVGQMEFRASVLDGRLTPEGIPSKASRIANQFVTQPERNVVNGMTELKWQPVQNQSPAESQHVGSVVAPTGYEQSTESTELPEKDPAVLQQRLRVASRFLSTLGQVDPDLANSPWYQWKEVSISRNFVGDIRSGTSEENRLRQLNQPEGLSVDKNRSYRQMERLIAEAAKRELIRLGEVEEIQAADNDLRIDMSVVGAAIDLGSTCLLTSTPPKLDGVLDDSFWKAIVDASELRNQIRFARDQEYLYVGIVCRKLPGVNYQWDRQPRPRDADLTRRDRIAIELDLDRDYRTSFRFEIDHRGWVNESCDQTPSWDPQWYVGQSENESTWTIEAAIPLNELVSSQIAPTSIWGVKANRLTGPSNDTDVSMLQVQAPATDDFQWLFFAPRQSPFAPRQSPFAPRKY